MGPKGRSGVAPPYPKSPCHTLEEWAPVPPGDQAGRLLLGLSPQARGYDVSGGECDSGPFTCGNLLEALGFSGCRDVE